MMEDDRWHCRDPSADDQRGKAPLQAIGLCIHRVPDAIDLTIEDIESRVNLPKPSIDLCKSRIHLCEARFNLDEARFDLDEARFNVRREVAETAIDLLRRAFEAGESRFPGLSGHYAFHSTTKGL